MIPVLYPITCSEKPIWSSKELGKITIEYLAERMVQTLDCIGHAKFDSIVIGPSNGGLSQIASMLGVPYLPTQMTIMVLCPTHGLKTLAEIERRWTAAVCTLKTDENTKVMLHYDPIHDNGVVENAIFMRMQFNRLPPAYSRFIEKHLKKGGNLIFIDAENPALQTQLSENVWLQLGSFNHIDYREIVDSSGYSFEKYPDAEGGSSPLFKGNLEEYAKNGNYELVYGLVYDTGTCGHLSTLLSKKKNNESSNLIIGSYTLMAPLSAQSEWISTWIPFVDQRSYQNAEGTFKLLEKDRFDKIIFGCDLGVGEDIVKQDEWKNLLANYTDDYWILGATEDYNKLTPLYPKMASNFTDTTHKMFLKTKKQKAKLEDLMRSCEELKILR